MSAPEMFGGQLQNFGEPQNVGTRTTQNAITREGSPESPALDLKCYNSTPATTSTSGRNTSNLPKSTNSNSPPTVVDSPSPTQCDQQRSTTPVDEPENLSTTLSDKQEQPGALSSSSTGGVGVPIHRSISREDMDTGRSTPMPAATATMRDYMHSQHQQQMQHQEPAHPPPSLLGNPSSLYQPYPAGAGASGIRAGSYYPIEHYFPNPANQQAAVNESRHALPPPPPIAKTPPR